ncbi:NUDIX hydrolase [Actibacterium mucosum KCTC 23349]|uniref:NUDIX hydrolase n=1 Tax=Actibacterium mucosum KCTC 23349 TaxID=1454373 RepID=A0A037ZJX8_9RHOB|nr:NUDIX domain-containing protein [Actibacterium mucosum]KAJ55151.1 NUDIX hydrolase [Actibacterium mucosum KCTC 23349]
MSHTRPPRLAVRAVMVHENRLLLVNAWADPSRKLWCAPGGGVEPGASLPDNLQREVMEETGLSITVGAPCLVNEFHDPKRDFHQVEVFFHCALAGGALSDTWQDPEGIVTRRKWFSQSELRGMHLKPSSLPDIAFGGSTAHYDPLEPIVF